MSVEAMSWAQECKTGSVSRKAVLMSLADRAGFDWTCWPSQATIARNAELSERQVRRILGELEEGGFISRRRRTDKRGHRGSDIITLIPTGQYVRLVATDLPDIAQRLADMEGALPDIHDHPYRTPMSGESSVEPLVEESSLEPKTSSTWPTFDDFWSFYAKKKGKGEARILWAKLSKADQRDAIEGARRHGQMIDDNPGVFVLPEGPVWIRKRRWEEDEPRQPPGPQTRGQATVDLLRRKAMEPIVPTKPGLRALEGGQQ